MKNTYLILTLSFIVSCASHQKGEFAHVKSGNHPGDLPITGFIDKDSSNEYLKSINIQFHNKNDHWVRIKSVEIDTEKNPEILAITQGQDLIDWQTGFAQFKQIENHNNQAAFAAFYTLAAVGAIAGMSSGDTNLASGSLIAMNGSLIANAANEISDSINDLERAKQFPKNHLFKPFSVAPGLYSKKWVVVEKRKETSLCKLRFKITYENDEVVNYKVNLKDKGCS